jgi:hypothetical protein
MATSLCHISAACPLQRLSLLYNVFSDAGIQFKDMTQLQLPDLRGCVRTGDAAWNILRAS